jgi:hypothetical protein
MTGHATAAVLVFVGLGLGACTPEAGAPGPATPSSAGPPAPSARTTSPTSGGPQAHSTPSIDVNADAHVRSIGPADQGRDIVLRVGDRLVVTPASRPMGWVVADFPTPALRLQGSPRGASSHTFLAVAVGEGPLTLSPAGPEANATGAYVVRIRVMRDTVLPPPP